MPVPTVVWTLELADNCPAGPPNLLGGGRPPRQSRANPMDPLVLALKSSL